MISANARATTSMSSSLTVRTWLAGSSATIVAMTRMTEPCPPVVFVTPGDDVVDHRGIEPLAAASACDADGRFYAATMVIGFDDLREIGDPRHDRDGRPRETFGMPAAVPVLVEVPIASTVERGKPSLPAMSAPRSQRRCMISSMTCWLRAIPVRCEILSTVDPPSATVLAVRRASLTRLCRSTSRMRGLTGCRRSRTVGTTERRCWSSRRP